MVYVDSIESNVKGKFAYELARKTLIVGKNRSGKTRVTEALSLALTGTARTPYLTKYDYETIALKPLEAKKLTAQASLSDDGLARYELAGSTSSTAKKKHTVISGDAVPVPAPSAEVLSDVVQMLLRGDSKKLANIILRAYGSSVPLDVLTSDCPPQLRDRMLEFFGAVPEGDPINPQEIIEIIEVTDKMLYGLRREKQGIEKALEHLSDEPLTDEELGQLGLLNAALAGTDLRARLKQQIEEQRARLNTEMENIRQAIMSLEGADTAELNVQLLNDVQVVLDDLSALMAKRQADQCACPVCLTPSVNLTQFEVTSERVVAGLSYYAEVSDLTRIKREIAKLNDELDRLEETPAYGLFGDDAGRVQGLIAELEQKRADTNRAVDMRIRAQKCEQDVEEVAAINKYLRAQSRRVLRSAVKPFCDAANEVMPDGFSVDLILKAGRRDVCHLALNSPDALPHLSGALSGAEIALLTVSLAHAIAAVSKAFIKILIIDDVWMDTSLLTLIVKAIDLLFEAKAPAIDQVILCAVSADVALADDWQRIVLS